MDSKRSFFDSKSSYLDSKSRYLDSNRANLDNKVIYGQIPLANIASEKFLGIPAVLIIIISYFYVPGYSIFFDLQAFSWKNNLSLYAIIFLGYVITTSFYKQQTNTSSKDKNSQT